MRTRLTHKPDWWFVGLFAAILAIGLIMLSSVSTAVAFQKFGDPFFYIKAQLTKGVIPGLILMFIISKIDYRVWKRFAFSALILSVVLLVLVLIPGLGSTFGGARSWLNLGPILFQPSEVVKLTFLIYLASWLAAREGHVVRDVSFGLMPFLTVLGIIMFLILLQPDVGTMSVIVFISLAVYFVAGASIPHLMGLGALGVFGLYILVRLAPYRIARFTVFLHPELDPQGIGYQINQAFMAIGSGGLLGMGLGHSRQKYLYLPEVIGDSIFAVTAEELGFIVTSAVVILFAALVVRGFQIARSAPDKFGTYLVSGIMAWIGIQAFVNMAGVVGLLPLTGLTLPFMSYGSSSLIVLLVATGMVVNVSRYSRN